MWDYTATRISVLQMLIRRSVCGHSSNLTYLYIIISSFKNKYVAYVLSYARKIYTCYTKEKEVSFYCMKEKKKCTPKYRVLLYVKLTNRFHGATSYSKLIYRLKFARMFCVTS